MTLKDIYKKYPNENSCIEFLEKIVWGKEPKCPYCNMAYTTPFLNERRHKCNTCNMSFSVTVKTFLHKTKCDLQKWFYLITLLDYKNDFPSVRQLSEEMYINKDTAARMIRKLKSTNTNDINLITKISNKIKNE